MKDIRELKKLGEELKVLYVEDEKALQKAVAKYLMKIFNYVKTASNGEEGLELYKNEPFDIVITDIKMPLMDGLEMSAKIKEINKKQNIIIISAYSDVKNFTESIYIGIDGYIIKPVDFDQMNEVLYKVMFAVNEIKINKYYEEHLKELVEIKTKESNELFEKNLENYKQTLYGLVELIEKRDTYTGGHSQRVANYSKILALALGCSKEECEDVYEAGMLHDIGKIAIPDSILLNPSSLTQNEYNLIKNHVNIGYDMLIKVSMFEDIAKIIVAHHERFDGSGYPNGTKEEEIPLLGRIMAIADAFDAMTTSRIYKAKKTIQEAIDEIKKLSGKDFCPKIVEHIDILKEVKIDEDISQLPTNEMEQERFAYFYKDQISGVYNKNYLNLILAKNKYSNYYKHHNQIILKDFSLYNNKYGWDKGDQLLKDFAEYIKELYKTEDIYRVNGNDFVILSVEKFDFKKDQIELFLKDHDIELEFESLELIGSSI